MDTSSTTSSLATKQVSSVQTINLKHNWKFWKFTIIEYQIVYTCYSKAVQSTVQQTKSLDPTVRTDPIKHTNQDR